MGGSISENRNVLFATLFAVVLIVGAYFLARGVESPSVAQASTETELLKAIASKDSDNDGLPDWEESLYGTDAHVADTFKLDLTDGEAVARGLIVPKAIADITVATSTTGALVDPSLPPAPAEGTITATFAKNFFTFFLAAKQKNGGGDLTEAQMNDVATQSLASLTSSIAIAPDFKSTAGLTVEGSGAEALKTFATNAEAIFMKNTSTASTSEINYLKQAIENDDDAALAHIASIAKAYRDTAVGLAALPVPKELADTDLALINAMMRVSELTSDFTRVNTDPMASILALNQYPQTVLKMGNAFIQIGNIYKTEGVTLQKGEPGAQFVNMIQNIADKQASSATKNP
jgi:hypothetical protein